MKNVTILGLSVAISFALRFSAISFHCGLQVIVKNKSGLPKF